MRIGISGVGIYIPEKRVDNYDKLEKYNITESFIDDVTGIRFVSKKENLQKSSDLCVLAYDNLVSTVNPELLENIGCICVCTQNGDYQIPQTSSILHGKLGLSIDCAAFDISLGCSGYVYALHIMKSFMEDNDIETGLLFTSDSYSDIIDLDNKETDLLFGDASTVTVLSNNPKYILGKGVFQTMGIEYDALILEKDKMLKMEGRRIFNFSLKSIPPLLKKCLLQNDIQDIDVDKYFFHQASKYMLERVSIKLKLDKKKVPFNIRDFGNTVSSSIPILIYEILNDDENNKIIVLCGFGVGLSMASTILIKNKKIKDF